MIPVATERFRLSARPRMGIFTLISQAAAASGVRPACSLPISTSAGALIQSVSSGGAAEQAGLQAGDVVTEFNGLPVTDSIDLTALVRTLPAGGDAKLTFTRDGSSKTVDVTLGQLAG